MDTAPAPSSPPSRRPATPGVAMDVLLPLVYRELKRLARVHRRRRSPGETLSTTALVHETWLKLARSAGGPFADRDHFLSVASMAMRQVVVDHARRRMAEKRGGERVRVSLEALTGGSTDPDRQAVAVLALDQALERLETLDPGLARLAELRFFGDAPVDDVARILGLSTATVKRHTRVARAFLARELELRPPPTRPS